MTRNPPPEPPLRRQQALALSLHALVLLMLVLHITVQSLPPTPTPIPAPEDAESAWWGLWPARSVPDAVFWGGVVVLLAAVAWGVWRTLRPGEAQAPRAYKWTWILGAISLLLVAAFVAFPIAHTRWGDAYMLSKGLAWPDPALRITHSWQAPLDVFLHSRLWHWLGPRFGWEDAAPVYRILSPLAGAAYLAAAVGLSAGTRVAAPWLPYGLLASLGVVQLFFGYVENYAFAAAGVLIYLWLALRTLDSRTPLWVTASALAVTHALHPSTIVLAPSLVVLAGLVIRRELGQRAGNKAGAGSVLVVAARALAQIALPMLVVGAATFAWMEWSGHGLAALRETDRPGGSDARWLVPLWTIETRWEHYTMFSWLHLRDILNEQALVAPVVVPALLLALSARPRVRREAGDGHAFVFLAAAAICYLLFVLAWNPDYGGQRDWDLFSLVALPMTVLAAFVIDRALPDRRLLRAAMGPAILFQALHTAAWIYSNTLPWEWPA